METLLAGLAGVVALSTPVVLATLGETLTERAGVINLSLNGMILLSAMASFAVAVHTNSLLLGFLTGALVGLVVTLLVAVPSLHLGLSQVAVGFVLTLLTRDLSYFLGSPYMGKQGPRLSPWPLPGLQNIPILGPVFFRQDVMVYLSYLLIVGMWFWFYRTRAGLVLRSIGERPEAAYVRGAYVRRLQYIYTLVGGAIAGLAGPTYSLSVKAGWKGTISGLDGVGWIALALTIFGGWRPLRGAVGAYLFGLLQWLSLVLQPYLTDIPSQVLQVAPFPIMILLLLFVNIGNTEWMQRTLAGLPPDARRWVLRVLKALQVQPPAALGRSFERE